MNENELRDKIHAVVNHENQKILSQFGSVGAYLNYKVKSYLMAKSAASILHDPFALKGLPESIEMDSPYFPAVRVPQVTTVYGQRISDYVLRSTQTTLDTASVATGGALKWSRTGDDEGETFYVWFDPENITENYNWMAKTLSEVGMVTEDTPLEDISQAN